MRGRYRIYCYAQTQIAESYVSHRGDDIYDNLERGDSGACIKFV